MAAATGAIIAGAASLGGTAVSAAAQGKMNKRTERYNKWAMQTQREWALSDWRMQNEYNHPSAQMQRFRDAGLNPHLIYGQTNEAAAVRSNNTPNWNPQAPDYTQAGRGVASAVDTYFNTQMKEAQINNLKAQNDNILAQKNYIDAQTQEVHKRIENYDSQIGLRQWNLDSSKSLFPASLEMQDWKIRHLAKDMDIKTQTHEYNLLKAAQTLEKGAVDVINSRIDTHLKRLDAAIKAGIITQQVYDRERTKAEIARTQASEMLLNESRRSSEFNRIKGNASDYLKDVENVTRFLQLWK